MANPALKQASTDPNHKICIFGPQYCFPTQFQLQMREKFFRLREDCFKITDTNGQLFFQVKNPWMSMREKHVLKDAYGVDICKMKKKLWACRYTWHMNTGDSLEDRRATMAFRHCSCHTKCYVYVYDQPYPHEDSSTDYGGMKPAIMIKSSICGFDVKIYDGETEELYGHMSKEMAQEFLLGRDSYVLTVQPGIDIAFMTSLALMWDYAVSDMKKDNSG